MHNVERQRSSFNGHGSVAERRHICQPNDGETKTADVHTIPTVRCQSRSSGKRVITLAEYRLRRQMESNNAATKRSNLIRIQAAPAAPPDVSGKPQCKSFPTRIEAETTDYHAKSNIKWPSLTFPAPKNDVAYKEIAITDIVGCTAKKYKQSNVCKGEMDTKHKAESLQRVDVAEPSYLYGTCQKNNSRSINNTKPEKVEITQEQSSTGSEHSLMGRHGGGNWYSHLVARSYANLCVKRHDSYRPQGINVNKKNTFNGLKPANDDFLGSRICFNNEGIHVKSRDTQSPQKMSHAFYHSSQTSSRPVRQGKPRHKCTVHVI